MQTIGAIVHRHMVGMPVQLEDAFGEAISVAADKCPEMPGIALSRVSVEIIEAQHHVGEFLIATRRLNRGDCSAVVGDLDLHAGRIGQRVQKDFLPVGRAERLLGGFGNCHGRKGQNGECE